MNFFDTLFDEDLKSKTLVGLSHELKCIYLYNQFRKYKRSIVFIVNSLYEANQYLLSLRTYTDSVLFFPMDDFLTSEALAISPEFKITRLETLESLLKKDSYIVITNLMGSLRFLPNPSLYKKAHLSLTKNMDYPIENLKCFLFNMGYEREPIINKTGEYADRGYVIDVFPMNQSHPVRIEFWGDTIESIRIFDIDTQRTIEEISSVIIPPNSEFICENMDSVDVVNRFQKYLCQYTEVSSLFDYVPDCVVAIDEYHQFLTGYQLLVDEMYSYKVSNEISTDFSYMHDLSILPNQLTYYFESFDNEVDNILIQQYPSSDIESFVGTSSDINNRLNKYIVNKKMVVICLSDRYQVQKVADYLQNELLFVTDITHLALGKINLVIRCLMRGFEYKNFVVISEREIFHKKDTATKYKTNFKFGTRVRDITKLQLGDYIVHSIYGIGRYVGIKSLMKNGLKKDYLQLEYKGEDKLYIPVEKIDLITKYSSNDSLVPKLNSLNSGEWAKTKLRVRKKIENIASELIQLYAKREAQVGFSYFPDTEEQILFERDFPYTETVDQLKVTDEIKKDMESSKPMDRLLCGDVGYGKTEVAFRAMFKAISASKQVAFLCPTTILSNQHYQNAIVRFANFPVRIAMLNRFVTGKKKTEILKDVEDGKIDILIGTHRILSSDVVFHDLGLLVIDEEQRFGVKHKERIKQYKNSIDVLTLSATPIPRTLQMSMSGIRSLSLIETPPVDRYPIQTYVLAYNPQIVRDAIYKELSRNGQVFMLYNHIDDMEQKKLELSKLVPDARIVIAHGRMDKTTLENVMMKFIQREYDILLCTTIIETGIDIPSVNTLLIMDADHFGLSQLYQIRGRVGRSNVIAYCYLMYDKARVLTDVAVKRLKVIKDFTQLGSGFSIAMRDLSIRGAGDILGSEQAGFIDSVGIELFMHMLQEEISKLKGEKVVENQDSDLQPLVNVETTIEDTYVSDEDLKIMIHQKINSIDSYDRLCEVKQEIEDRFGRIDESLNIYMHEEWFEKLALQLSIHKVHQAKNFVEVYLGRKLTQSLDGQQLFMEVSALSRMFRFSMKAGELVIILDTVKLDKHFIYYLIDLLQVIMKSIHCN